MNAVGDRVKLRPLLLTVGCLTLLSYAISLKLSSPRLALLQEDDSPSWLPYLHWYQCLDSLAGRIAYVIGLCFWLLWLFVFVGVVASDFFCPNLSTISSRLGLSESVAGSTLLAFGNGSPDVFSTFASLGARSGSLAIGELLGAAAFIVTVVAGIMTLVKPFKVARHSFLRDVGFFTFAVALTLVILWDKVISRIEAALMIILYFLYVVTVAVTSWWHGRKERIREALRKARDEYAEEDISGSNAVLEPYRDHASSHGSTASSSFVSPRVMPKYYPPMDEDEVLEAAERSSPIVLTPSQPFPPRSRTRSGSIAGTALGRRTKSRNTAVRPSLLGAIEFRDVVNSLAENSSANSLAIFGDLDASGSSDGRPPSRISIGHRSLSHVPRAGSQHDGTVRPSHRRAVSATEVPLETPLEFDASVWDKPLGSADKAGRVDLIDLSEGVENPWKSTSASASPLHPRQLLKLDTSMLPQNVVSASPLPVTPRPRPASQNKAVRKVPSIILVNEAGQETPVTLLSPPDTPTGVRIPSWMVSSGRRRRKIKLALRSLKGALFPSLNGFRQKSIVAAFLAIVSTPAVFVLIITLPVVDEEGDDDASEYQEKEIVISHHTLTSQPPPEDEDEEEQEGWQDRARLRNDHIAHVLHSPVAFRRSGPLPDSYSAPVDLDGVDAELVRQQPDAYTEFDVDGNPREYFPSGGLSPPASIKGDLDQDAMDQKVSDALILVQCALSPFFVVMTTLGDELRPWYFLVAGGTSIALCLISSAIIRSPTKKGRVFLCLVGFVVAMVWLLTCVNEVVGVLQAIGHVFGLSDAILGITVFALGNSTADLVANYTIARMGYPVMAISACYGGPLLNILLGVGVSGTYFIAKFGQPYYIDFDVTLITTCTALLILLIFTLIFIPWNGYVMSRKWGIFLISFYLCMTALNVIVELKKERTHKHR